MMGVYKFYDEHTSTLSPDKLYKAVAEDAAYIVSHLINAIPISVETVEGNGGPGTVKKLTVGEGSLAYYVLLKIEAIDEANLEFDFSMVGGTDWHESIEKILFETKIEDGPDGGSIGKATVSFYTVGDTVLSDELLEVTKAKESRLFRAIEGFVLANPDYL